MGPAGAPDIMETTVSLLAQLQLEAVPVDRLPPPVVPLQVENFKAPLRPEGKIRC